MQSVNCLTTTAKRFLSPDPRSASESQSRLQMKGEGWPNHVAIGTDAKSDHDPVFASFVLHNRQFVSPNKAFRKSVILVLHSFLV